MKFNFFHTVILLLLLTTSFGTDLNKEMKDNSLQAIPAPHTKYFITYTLNAERGKIVKLPHDQYQLILTGIDKEIIYHLASGAESSGTILSTPFIKNWQQALPSNTQGKCVRADITGVQIDNKSVGHKQFYQMAKLSFPVINQYEKNELSFNIALVKPTQLNNNKEAFQNVSVFIDGYCFCKYPSHLINFKECLNLRRET